MFRTYNSSKKKLKNKSLNQSLNTEYDAKKAPDLFDLLEKDAPTPDAIRSLLENKADVNYVDSKNGDTPLLKLVKSITFYDPSVELTSILRLLLEKKPNVSARDRGGETALQIAKKIPSPFCLFNLSEIIQILVKEEAEHRYNQQRSTLITFFKQEPFLLVDLINIIMDYLKEEVQEETANNHLSRGK